MNCNTTSSRTAVPVTTTTGDGAASSLRARAEHKKEKYQRRQHQQQEQVPTPSSFQSFPKQQQQQQQQQQPNNDDPTNGHHHHPVHHYYHHHHTSTKRGILFGLVIGYIAGGLSTILHHRLLQQHHQGMPSSTAAAAAAGGTARSSGGVFDMDAPLPPAPPLIQRKTKETEEDGSATAAEAAAAAEKAGPSSSSSSLLQQQTTAAKSQQQQQHAAPAPAAASSSSASFPPPSMRNLVAGMSRVDRKAFLRAFDHGYGVDKDDPSGGNSDVLLLHLSPDSVPLERRQKRKEEAGGGTSAAAAAAAAAGRNNNTTTTTTGEGESSTIPHYYDSVETATAACAVLKTVTVDPHVARGSIKYRRLPDTTCLAVVGNWESYTVNKWERRNKQQNTNNKNKNNNNKNSKKQQQQQEQQQQQQQQDEQDQQDQLVPVPARRLMIPSAEETDAAYAALDKYLTSYGQARERLNALLQDRIGKPAVAGTTAGGGKKTKTKQNPVIVMVANIGQAKYFVNFICAARARGLLRDVLDRLIMFATDEDMYRLSSRLNVTTFYDETVFHAIPTAAAVNYRDPNYGLIMMSKVYCVHLVNSLGYDLLFQDVDLVWYRNPLNYFNSDDNNNKDKEITAAAAAPADFDMYFQHDGTHHPVRFAPMAANTGFYYVRYNDRTRHFFDVFVRMGDLVLADKSHQAAMSTLINEHGSTHNLRVKVLAESEQGKLFLSGFHYHADKPLMKRVLRGHHEPIIFHSNWMEGKMKEPALRETKNWYVSNNNQCSSSSGISTTSQGGNITATTTTTTARKMKIQNDNDKIDILYTDCCLAVPAEAAAATTSTKKKKISRRHNNKKGKK